MGTDDDVLSPEEVKQYGPLLVSLFTGLYFLTLIFNILFVAVLLCAGWRGLNPFYVIPVSATIWFILRVMKTYARNLMEDTREEIDKLRGTDLELDALDEFDLDEVDNEDQGSIEPTSIDKPSPTKLWSTFLVASIAMLLAVTFWYGIGYLLRLFTP